MLAVLTLFGGAPVHAQTPDAAADRLLDRLRVALAEGDAHLFASLFDAAVPAAEVAHYRRELMRPDVVRRVVRERARLPFESAEGDGLGLAVDVFEERAGEARLLTTSLVLRRDSARPSDEWRIGAIDGSSALDGLYRLRLDTTTQYDVRGLELAAPDLLLTLEDGALFTIASDAGITGVVVAGRGRMRFSPEPESERLQVELFAGEAPLDDEFETLLLRFHPSDFHRLIAPAALRPVPVDPRAARRAADVASRELANSYLVDVRDVSGDDWHMLPRESDVLAEVRTRRHGTLTYSHVGARAEDISLVRRDRRLTVALYTSANNMPAVGRSYNEEDLREYDVLDYEIDATVGSDHRHLQAHARLRIRTRTPLSSLTLRLAEALGVHRVTSPEFGPLGFVRIRDQHAVFVRLPRMLDPDTTLTLEVGYAGRVRSQPLDSDGVQEVVEPPLWAPEPRLLLSSASDWYPQNVYVDFATATLRVTAPAGSAVVASGTPLSGSAASAESPVSVFRAGQPLRYLALLVTRLTLVETRTLVVDEPEVLGRAPLRMHVLANPLQRRPARGLADAMEEVLRFYAGMLGDVPYPTSTLAVVDAALPGGHSPAYFMMLHSPIMTSPLVWRRDPAAFPGFPEFFLAHELAHQWWGQAVGTKNYREQWISEGFAQYSAAMYAEHARGEQALHDMLKEFRRWSLSESEMGPVALGGRLGHVEGGGRAFRAVVYNKGAAVLHMLRRIVGDDRFVRGLRRFYHEHRFRAAGTDDLQRVFEAESGRSLERFFDRWIRGASLPTVRVGSAVAPGAVTVRLEQLSEDVFDLPVTVSVTYRDGRVEDVVMVMTERHLERTIPVDGEVRRVEVNRDSAALAEFTTR